MKYGTVDALKRSRISADAILLASAWLCLGAACSNTSTTLLTLDSLSVAPLTLNPPFSPAIHDYFVACGAGTNSLTLAAAALPGATVRLLRPTTTAAASSQSLPVDMLEDQAIVLEVAALGSTDQYWVRCLPHDFPRVSVTSYPSSEGPTPGWYLIANISLATGESSFAMAVDAHGTPVWYRRVSTTVGALNVEALETDTISFTPQLGASFGTDPNGRYEIHQLGASQVRYVQAVGSPTDHHELRLLSNGDAMVISFALTPGVDLTGNGSYGPNTTIADCAIQELDSAGNLVWSWLASDHFDPAKESVTPPLVAVNGENVVDIFHCNSIDVGADGNLLVSARHLNAVFMIDRATDTVVWKMGGVAYNKDGAQLIQIQGDPETSFNRQHDARRQPNGNISLFDDHSDGTAPARGVEYAIDFSSGIATVAWQYQGSASSAAMGSCRRYADGNTVIGWGTFAGGLVLSEVDSLGHDVLDISFSSGDASYRAVKVTEAMVDLNKLRETAGLP
jgi:Arylsulfotransferase (ASST)